MGLLLVVVTLAGALAGCGSGGGGGGGGGSEATAALVVSAPAPAAPPPGRLTAGSYLVAGRSSSETAGHRLMVADAEAMHAAAVLSVPVAPSTQMMSTTAYAQDAVTLSTAIVGAPMTFFVNSRQLWQIDLAQSRTPVSVRISSLSDVCELLMVAPLDSSGLDAWVLVSTAGPDGLCWGTADNRQAFVRSGTPATVAATMVPASTQVQQLYLSGHQGALWWMPAVDNAGAVPRLVAYGPTLQVVEVSGGAGIRALNTKGHAPSAAEGVYLRTDDELRRVEVNASGLRIGAPLFRFAGALSLTIYERPAMYFTDQDIVYKVQGEAPAMQLARPNPGAVSSYLLAQSPNSLLIRQEHAGGGSVSAIDKRTSAVTPLLSQPGDGSNAVWAMRGTTLYYFTGSFGKVGALRRVEVDGSDDALVVTNVMTIGSVSSRTWDAAQSTPIAATAALLVCQPLPGNVDCRSSTLLQIDLPSRTVTALGSFADSSAPVWVAQGGGAYQGVKGAMVEVRSSGSSGSQARQDLYFFNPGEANSLRQVTVATP